MYVAPLKDIRFTLDHMVDSGKLVQTQKFAEASAETRDAVITEAGKLCEGVLAPLNHPGDIQGARLENGVVRTPDGFPEAYEEIAQGGWIARAASEEHGGMGLPLTYQSAVNEMMASSCLSISLNPLMTQGQIEALEAHASPELQAIYLPKLLSGEWTGTMNLTEPQAGSDVGALNTKAVPNGDGTYAITGGKIWISWGDHDVAANVSHLVLARLAGAPPGVRGISLFLVPKFIPDANGEPGVRNGLQVVSLDHKLGLHGSPTCVMAYEGATGWLVGEENHGLACMFTMMNNARLGVGLQGIGVAEAAYQKALAFATDRKQGKTPPFEGGSGAIVDHADVRRMLILMKAQTQAARAIAYDCALHLDLAHAAETEEERRSAEAMSAFLTPIAKAFGTDTGNEVAHLGVQVHGGMGFIEETGAAQYSRDVRVTAIYEGTNGIQAMDLVGRKLSMDAGQTAFAYVASRAEIAEALSGSENPALQAVGKAIASAASKAKGVTQWMLDADQNDRNAGAVAYLRLLALLGGASYLGRGAMATGDPVRIELARFFADVLLPQAHAMGQAAVQGASGLYALSPDDLAA
ncbi:MAG: acyl-CoA dehydrogenase family protein [Neomegalonema sp.]